MLGNLIELKKRIFDNSSTEQISISIKKCLNSFLDNPNTEEFAIFYYLLNLITLKELEDTIRHTKKILDLIKFPLKFQAI